MALTLSPNDPRIVVFVATADTDLDHSTYLDRLRGAEVANGLAEVLGTEVDPGKVEVFDARDVDGIGLRGYLAQAYDIDPAALEADAPWLDSAKSTVLVLGAGAARGGGTLAPAPGLQLVNTYRSAQADMASRILPDAASETEPRPVRQVTSTSTLSPTMIAVIVIAALVLGIIALRFIL